MRFLKVLVILLLGCCPAMAREYEVSGPEGGIAFKISLPEGFNPKTDRCPMVILMHGIFSSKDFNPMPAGRLAAEGTPPDGLVLLAPGSVIKEACQAGKFFNARFNPADSRKRKEVVTSVVQFFKDLYRL